MNESTIDVDCSSLSHEKKNKVLFLIQKNTLDQFLECGAISQEQHDKSPRVLVLKMAK